MKMLTAGNLLLRLLLIVLLWSDRGSAVKWLALYRSKQKIWNQTTNCTKSYGLVSRQVKICRNNLDLMSTVSHSSFLTVDTCQRMFADRRWNCSSVTHSPKLNKDLKRGTREQAYVYAISSAALAHSLARACSIGVTTKCSCGSLPNSPPEGDFKWGGCGDDVLFGIGFSEVFTDSSLVKKGKVTMSKKAQMNRHNNKAGRKVIKDSLTKACKCHGVSGSCSVKTCWRAMPNFDAIGDNLKRHYSYSVEVRTRRINKVKQFVPILPTIASIADDSLIYYSKSPDYCSPDVKTGSIGTQERLCDKDSHGSGGCDSMCCGRGYKGFDLEVIERCECKYYWCCYVKCKTCSKTLHLFKCR